MANVVSTTQVTENSSGKTPLNTKSKLQDDDEEEINVNNFVDEEIDLADWVLS